MLFTLSFAAAQSDVEGSKDPALFTRMPGWYINQYEENEFASYEFTGDKGAVVVVEGHKIKMGYTWAGEKKKPSSLQVIRNYENALKKIGGSVPYRKSDDFITMKVVKNGKETWAEINSEVDAGWGGFTLTIVEKDAMVQQVTANAEALRAGIREAGHAAVYGINFDADKAVLRPGADAAIAEIAKLLKQDGTLKLFVVGHTANSGDVGSGLQLSQERAAAVVKKLIDTYGIEAARLSPFGAGPYCPVATNLSEDGRAQNRRVELVPQ
jgi:outer membrane protein OmpA-like peptidoglycan-associated protein